MPLKDIEVIAQGALARATLFSRRFAIEHPDSSLQDLLKLKVLRDAIEQFSNIHGWLPMDTFPLPGYVSWLGKWLGHDHPPSIAIKSSIFSDLLRASATPKHPVFVFLAIILHEVGHEVMRDPTIPRKFRTPIGNGFAADLESLKSEAEAWLFSFALCGLIFARVVSDDRPDTVHEYLV